MTTQATAMVLASFAADSLALGAHWIYDTAEIDRRFGRVDRLLKPRLIPITPARKAASLPITAIRRWFCWRPWPGAVNFL
jgi:hypothetical protein